MIEDNLVNESRVRVISVLEELVRNEDKSSLKFCTCKHCLSDIAAIASNNLPPRYCIISEHAYEDKRAEGLTYDVIKGKVEEAIEIVTEYPHHDREI